MDKQKEDIKNWWSNHSQDYKYDYKSEYLGIDCNSLNDEEFLSYIKKLDLTFSKKAYFAQKKGQELFSNLISNDNLKNKKVLEIGCGLGSHSEIFARRGAKIFSIDLSKTSVDFTTRRFRIQGLEGDIRQADCENLPFQDNYFDYVWSWGVIHHTTNTELAALEIQRVLKKGGKCDIMIYNNNSLYKYLNVYLRYGLLRLKFFQNMSKQELKNKYTDGKEIGGSPLSKYYSKKQFIKLFPNLKLTNIRCYEQKNFFSFWVPKKYKSKFENFISDSLFTFIFKNIGFLMFANFIK